MLHEDDCSKAFEAVLAQSGKFGHYQRRLYAVVCFMHVVCTSILTYMKFVPNLELKQDCTEIIEMEAGNSTFIFLHFNETATFSINCHTFYDNDIGLEFDWTFPEWAFPGYDTDVRTVVHYGQCIGLAVGFVLGSILSDTLGRRRVMYVFFTLLCLTQCLCAVAHSWKIFLVCRVIVGFGAGGFILTSLVLLIEYVGHDWRDICICLVPWWLGPSLLSLEALATRHWRFLALVSGLAGGPLIGSYFIVFESSRWLLCHHRFSAAEHTIKEVVACNCRSVPELTTLFDIARTCILNTMHKKTFTFLDLFTTSKLRRGTIAVIFTWFLGSTVYCGLFRDIRQLTSNPYLNNFILYNTDAIVIVCAVLINKCLGRRWCLFLYAMSSGLVSLCILVLHVSNETMDMSMINSLGFFTKMGVTTTLTIINLVTLETYPTVVRTMGLCVGFLAGLTGYILADKVIVYLEPFHYTVPFLVYGGMMCILAFGVLFYPETIRKPLPDILRCRHRNLCAHDPIQLSNPVTHGWFS
ncbi:solute carrier family 22 member 4-like [Ruditapes philippinarum]|uniref:solute carrier family 22 member 4-like n=1 Tax=Ruditapes philippinarum TaxID=129788 RepID=UPI00295BA1D8|nr:solute carrier family 22 member 4-like [Ruditapes philippinarum]